MDLCQCPHGLIPHCYAFRTNNLSRMYKSVNALTGLYLIATSSAQFHCTCTKRVSMPSRAYTSLLRRISEPSENMSAGVNALTGLYLIATRNWSVRDASLMDQPCQCPHGLIPHCYLLVSLMISSMKLIVSMPSRAYTSLLLPSDSNGVSESFSVSMPSRAYTSLLQLNEDLLMLTTGTCQCPHGLIPHCYTWC